MVWRRRQKEENNKVEKTLNSLKKLEIGKRKDKRHKKDKGWRGGGSKRKKIVVKRILIYLLENNNPERKIYGKREGSGEKKRQQGTRKT